MNTNKVIANKLIAKELLAIAREIIVTLEQINASNAEYD